MQVEESQELSVLERKPRAAKAESEMGVQQVAFGWLA